MNFKKRVNGSWVDTPHYIHNTSTDTITTLPADIYANDTTATVGLKGQMEQNGTPAPDSPITPSECGEMSINLTPNQKITSNTYSVTLTTHPLINALKNITPNENYTLSWEFSSNGSGGVYNQVRLYTSASGTLIKILQLGVSFTLTSEEIANLGALFCYFGIGNTDGYMDKFMLVEGSTLKDYEPYGIKIPILNGSQTTNVYLGEVESTRRIKKLVFDGTENWNKYAQDSSRWLYYLSITKASVKNAICTHCQYSSSIPDYSTVGVQVSSSLASLLLNLGEIIGDNTIENFKSYLQQQYAAGTPVTVWYVLAEPTTGIVNEPLRKIGDYADTVSSITIPTTAGANAVDVLTTLKPSEVTVNYHGWHPVSAVHKKSKNLLAVNNTSVTVGNITLTNDNGRITITGKTTAEIYSSNAAWKNTFSFLLSAGTYYFVGANSGGVSTTIRNYSDDVSIAGNNSTFTLTNDTMVYLGFYIYQNTNNDFTVMLNTGSTPLPYEPYWT